MSELEKIGLGNWRSVRLGIPGAPRKDLADLAAGFRVFFFFLVVLTMGWYRGLQGLVPSDFASPLTFFGPPTLFEI